MVSVWVLLLISISISFCFVILVCYFYFVAISIIFVWLRSLVIFCSSRRALWFRCMHHGWMASACVRGMQAFFFPRVVCFLSCHHGSRVCADFKSGCAASSFGEDLGRARASSTEPEDGHGCPRHGCSRTGGFDVLVGVVLLLHMISACGFPCTPVRTFFEWVCYGFHSNWELAMAGTRVWFLGELGFAYKGLLADSNLIGELSWVALGLGASGNGSRWFVACFQLGS